MINEDFFEKLKQIGSKIYNNQELEQSLILSKEVLDLKLDDESITISFFLKSNIDDLNIRNIIETNYKKIIIDKIYLLKRIGKVSLTGKKQNINELRKMFLELSDDISIIFIKLAEITVNLRYADQQNAENLEILSEEALYFYSPIAQQLGIRRIYHELEDISFRVLFPNDFKYLNSMIEKQMNIYLTKLNTIKLEIQKIMLKYKIEAKFQQRLKRPYSIYRKLVKQKIPLEQIYDLLALRIITKNVEECYLALGAVHSQWIPIEGRFRDWISFPKSNGYRSIQTTVVTRTGDKFEIQIRTEEMHNEAEYGSSAHWSYKQQSRSNEHDWVNRLREFLENDLYFDNPILAFDMLKQEMKRDYINVLTPKGEIKPLPEGSTILDYAFDVHTEIGYKTTGARVNGKFVKLNTILKSGDVIEIITNNNSKPSRDWLNIVKTNRAKSKILRWFKKNEQDLLILEGKNIWEKLKNKYKKKIIGNEDENKVRNNIIKLGFKGLDDFYYAIANGGFRATLYTLKKVYPDAFKKIEKEEKDKNKSYKDNSIPNVRVEGLENIETKLSKCCNPIKGEPIIAYITKKSVIKIHTANCTFIHIDELNNQNVKKAEWYGGETQQIAKIRILGDNYSKILSILVDEAENNKIKIIDTNKIVNKKYEGIIAEIRVLDFEHLNRLKSKLKNNPSIKEIK